MSRVFTPATLAQRWECSDKHVRNLIMAGELPAFRVGGKLLRIKGADVEDYECRNGVSLDSTEISASPGTIPASRPEGDVIDFTPPTQKKQPRAPRLDTQLSRARLARR